MGRKSPLMVETDNSNQHHRQHPPRRGSPVTLTATIPRQSPPPLTGLPRFFPPAHSEVGTIATATKGQLAGMSLASVLAQRRERSDARGNDTQVNKAMTEVNTSSTGNAVQRSMARLKASEGHRAAAGLQIQTTSSDEGGRDFRRRQPAGLHIQTEESGNNSPFATDEDKTPKASVATTTPSPSFSRRPPNLQIATSTTTDDKSTTTSAALSARRRPGNLQIQTRSIQEVPVPSPTPLPSNSSPVVSQQQHEQNKKQQTSSTTRASECTMQRHSYLSQKERLKTSKPTKSSDNT
eukprot:CAMPEP_0172492982 /NCGR_PEP_ID=MMETSP1066-20121228/24279_1 /TAXON_ID=671091 /ORGANISM="Coscinodiscus wailesii, Strain CCMP2513" /LENGTH=293 /DNA_ID=CAMNT_0013262887 /DNA_START=93 /DNA_END=970 /DNA_ORIENTATION=+